MMRRIERWLVASFILTTVSLADAQQGGKIPRIGFLDASTASGIAGLLGAFWQEMGRLGWIEGKNIAIEYRFAEQKFERLPELAAELVRLKLDLIVVAGTPSALAVKKATNAIPVPLIARSTSEVIESARTTRKANAPDNHTSARSPGRPRGRTGSSRSARCSISSSVFMCLSRREPS